MADLSLTNLCPAEKADNTYQTKHESLCAKLNHANAIVNLAVNSNPTQKQLFDLIWGLSDLLPRACDECEQLTASDLVKE